MNRVDVAGLLDRIDLVELVSRTVTLRTAGAEHVGLCPFHDERSPSFTVNAAKQFYHCFGCGAHGNAVDWLMRIERLGFLDACRRLGGEVPPSDRARNPLRHRDARARDATGCRSRPCRQTRLACSMRADVARPGIRNANAPRHSRRAPYTNTATPSALLGYVLRCEFVDHATHARKKLTPQLTFCVARNGERRWCVRPFAPPRPLYGLDALAAKAGAPVLVVEGEKCADAAAPALPMYATVAWPGGANGIHHVDWSPLSGRDVVLWPDADGPGRDAMLGSADRSGRVREGVAQLAWRAGARSLRFVDVSGVPRGWDIADALGQDDSNWTPRQLAAWAAARTKDVRVLPSRAAA
jgi:hypothetical protein